jgi:hypothetical protein
VPLQVVLGQLSNTQGKSAESLAGLLITSLSSEINAKYRQVAFFETVISSFALLAYFCQ